MENLQRKSKVLIIEDDIALAKVLSRKVQILGYEPTQVNDGASGLEEVLSLQYSLIICDLSLPKMNGYSIIKRMKIQNMKTPVILITNFGQEENEILSYSYGANIFHKKPIKFSLLESQIKMLITKYQSTNEFMFGDIIIDPIRRVVKKNKKDIPLTKKEFDLLVLLSSSAGEVFSRREIIERIAVTNSEIEEGSIDTLVSRIRKKIGHYRGRDIVETVYKEGYRLNNTFA